MKCIFKMVRIIIVLIITGFSSSCYEIEGNLEIINQYHEPIIRFALGVFMYDVNIAQGESYIHTPVSNSNRLFVITYSNKASNFVPFYAGHRITTTITLGVDGVLTINQ